MYLDTSVGKATLYIASVIFVIGVLYRLISWFFKSVGTSEKNIPISKRIFSGVDGLLNSLFSKKILSVIKVIIRDVIFQVKILTDKKDTTAWIMHFMIFAGFVALMLFHVFNIPENYSTLNPFMFLRNLFGLIVLAGIAIAIARRAKLKRESIKTGSGDIFVIIILAVIFVSGFLLEGLKITSYSDYNRMLDEYSETDNINDKIALEAYWVTHYGLVSPNLKKNIPEPALARGKKVNDEYCISCHSLPQSAFLSYGIAKSIKGCALTLDDAGIRTIMLYIHAIACLLGLAYIPFSKMFHIISTPISLVVAEISDKKQDTESSAIRQMIELDGCSHGGACHDECIVKKRRLERMEDTVQFDGSSEYISEKEYDELGSRKVSG